MYYNDYNRTPEENNNVVWNVEPDGAGQPTGKKSHRGLKIVALCLVCALLGGLGTGTALGALGGGRDSFSAGENTEIYTSERKPNTVTVANVDNHTKLTTEEIYATYVNSCVGITVDIVQTNIFGQSVKGAAAGSGFVITKDGYILTNYHVVEGANAITVTFADGTAYPATLVGGEAPNDVAVIKIDAEEELTPVIIGSSANTVVGEPVVTIGNPLGELTFSMTDGIVSALDRPITYSDGSIITMLQTNCAINSGNSGGPLFNLYGEVIGITSAKYSANGSSGEATIEGLGFAIPIDDVVDIATDLMRYGYVTGKPFLGISVGTVNSAVTEYGIPAGAKVVYVAPGLCAEKGGLLEGDIITAINGVDVVSSSQLIAEKNTYRAGDTVTFTVYRNGETLQVAGVLDEATEENAKILNDYVDAQEAAGSTDDAPYTGSGNENYDDSYGYDDEDGYGYYFPWGYGGWGW